MRQAVDVEALGTEMESVLRAKFPSLRRVVLEEGTDSTNDPALFIWLLLDDSVPDGGLSWSAIQPVVDEAESMARSLWSGAWPYARVRRLKEWEERNLLPEEVPEEEAQRA